MKRYLLATCLIPLSLSLAGLQGCGQAGDASGATAPTTSGPGPSVPLNDPSVQMSSLSTVIGSNGSTVITVSVLLGGNQPAPAGTRVDLSTSGVGQVTSSVITDAAGKATATFYANNDSGVATITAKTTVTDPLSGLPVEVTGNVSINVAPAGTASAISFDAAGQGSSYSRNVYLANTGSPQSSTLTFTVRSSDGAAIPNIPVTFTLPTAYASNVGYLLDPNGNPGATTSVTTNGAGQASATFSSGTVAGPAQIIASFVDPVSGKTISAAALITVGNGHPDLAHFSIAGTMTDKDGNGVGGTGTNLPGLVTQDYNGDFTVTLADRYGNPLSQGWGVSVYSPYMAVVSGDGSSSGAANSASGLTNPVGSFGFRFYPRITQDADLIPFVTSNGVQLPVLVVTSGTDSFVDANSNGIHDAGESFMDANSNGIYDAGESFTDANSNGMYDAGEACPIPGVSNCDQGTPYASPLPGLVYGNAVYNAKTDFIVNSPYIGPSSTFKSNTLIWKIVRVTLSGQPVQQSCSVDAATGVVTLTNLRDRFGAPMAPGNKIGFYYTISHVGDFETDGRTDRFSKFGGYFSLPATYSLSVDIKGPNVPAGMTLSCPVV